MENQINNIGKDLFSNTSEQIKELEYKLKKGLPDEVFQSLIACCNYHSNKRKYELLQPVDELIKEINSLFPTDRKLNAEEFRNAKKKHFELTDPSYVLKKVEDGLKIYDLQKEYGSFFEEALRETAFPSLLKRYEISPKKLSIYQVGIYEPMEGIFKSTKEYTAKLKDYYDLLKLNIKEKKESKGWRVGFGLTATLIAGPLGGVATRGIFDSLTGREKEIALLSSEASQSFNRMLDEIYNSLFIVLERHALIYLSIYGGLLLRLQEDLNQVGYCLSYYNDTEPERVKKSIGIKVKDTEKGKLTDWFFNHYTKILQSVREKDFKMANLISLDLLQFISNNKPASEVVVTEKELKFEVSTETRDYILGEAAVYVRYAVIMSQIEEELWSKEKYQEAVEAYMRVYKDFKHGISDLVKIDDIYILSFETIIYRMIIVHESYRTSRIKFNKANVQSDTQVISSYLENFLKGIQNEETCYGAVNQYSAQIILAYKGFISDQNIQLEKAELLEEWNPNIQIHRIYKYYKNTLISKTSFFKYLRRKRFSSKWNELTNEYNYLKILNPKVFVPITLTLFLLVNGMSYIYNQPLWPGVLNLIIPNQSESSADAKNLEVPKPVKETIVNAKPEESIIEKNSYVSPEEIFIEKNRYLSMDDQLHKAIKTLPEPDAIPIAKILLESGADTNSERKPGYTPVMLAVTQNYLDMLELLSDYSSDLDYLTINQYDNRTHESPRTALMIAASEGNYEAAKILLSAGANPNIQEASMGMTALMLAAMSENVDLVALLSEWGADVTIQSNFNLTSLDYVYASPISEEKDEIIRILEERFDEIYNENSVASENSTDSDYVTDSYYPWSGEYRGLASGNKNGTDLSLYNQTDSQIDFELIYWEIPWINDSNGGSWGEKLEQVVSGTAFINDDTALHSSSSCNLSFNYSSEGINVSKENCNVGDGRESEEFYILNTEY